MLTLQGGVGTAGALPFPGARVAGTGPPSQSLTPACLCLPWQKAMKLPKDTPEDKDR